MQILAVVYPELVNIRIAGLFAHVDIRVATFLAHVGESDPSRINLVYL